VKGGTKRYIFSGIGLALVVVTLCNLTYTRKTYMVIFKKTGVVEEHRIGRMVNGEVDIYLAGEIMQKSYYKNSVLNGWNIIYFPNGEVKRKSYYTNGQPDSTEFYYFDTGEVNTKESFKDGKREGLKLTYYKNGQIEQKLIRKNDKDEGVEYGYYENGKLMYKRYWVNNKLFGDQYFYYENGKVKIYHAYDILGDKFYISHYDESEKLTQNDGYIYSSHIYSKNVNNDSMAVLANGGKYSGIKDLYITFANPPHINTTAIKVVINNKVFKRISFIDSNITAKIVNAFPQKGKYHIVLDGAFLDKSNMVIGKGDVLGKMDIVKTQ